MTAQAGWYVDPRDSSQYRYWDGERWSQSTQPIPTENAGLSGTPANASLSSGGAGEPVGSEAFGSSTASAGSPDPGGESGDAPADLMWTSGFGDDATSSRPSADTFSPGEPAGQEQSPWQPQSVAPGATVGGADPTVAVPSAFTPTPPADSAGGGPIFQRDASEPAGADPAFTPLAPTAPTAPAQPESGEGGGSKIDQYTMPSGHVPPAPSGEPRRTRRKRDAAAADAAAGAATGAPADERPRRRDRSAGGDGPPPSAPAGKGSLPPGAKPAKAGSDSRLPLLLGVLGVVIVAAAAFLLLRGGDDDPATDVSTDPATDVTVASTVPATEPTVASTAVDTLPDTAPETTNPAIDPALQSAYSAEFAAEITRSCDIIKADPGRPTEDVIQFNESWTAIGVNYESLQSAVNECSKPARDAAYEAMVRGGG